MRTQSPDTDPKAEAVLIKLFRNSSSAKTFMNIFNFFFPATVEKGYVSMRRRMSVGRKLTLAENHLNKGLNAKIHNIHFLANSQL